MVYLQKGNFYGRYDKKGKLIKIYLIGDKVEAIANVYVCVVKENGKMSDTIGAIYYRQEDNYKLLEDGIPKIKSSYRRHLQHLMCNQYFYIKDERELPNVDKYLDNPKEYCKKQPTQTINFREQLRTGEYYRNKK